MKRGTVLAIGLVAVLLVAIPAVGLAAIDDGPDGDTADDAPDDGLSPDQGEADPTAPGERLSGVVGAGGAELDGDLDQRTFGIQMAQAATADAQADVVAGQLADIEQRLADLEQRKDALDQQRADGEISEGKYRAEVAKIAAQSRALEGLSNRTGEAAGGLPADLLADRGVDTERIETLRTQARNLSGGEVAEIARDIAGGGPNGTAPGAPPGGPPDVPSQGPPGDDGQPGGSPGEGDQSGGPPDDDGQSGGPPGDDGQSGGPPGDDS